MSKKVAIQIEKAQKSRIDQVDFDNLVFGREMSDHMVVVDYAGGAWQQPKIVPFQSLEFNPALTSLHYGQTIFEGIKAFKNEKGEINIFRPEEHAKRLNISAERLCMPTLPEEVFLETLEALLVLDKDWIPSGINRSLYIRPFMFATDLALGVSPSKTYKFIIFTSPVASYYSGTVKVKVETEFVRAAEGGTGYIKCGGNYAASLLPAKKALEQGYQQILWTDGSTHQYIEECGTMNAMFQIGDTIITPMLTSSILSGITRKSVVELAKRWGYKVEERKVSVAEIIAASKAGNLKDAFGTGTAATITHISHIGHEGVDYELPPLEEREFSNKVNQYLSELKIGKAEDYMNWITTY